MGKKMKYSTHPRKFGNRVTVHRPTTRPPERPSVRTIGVPMFTLNLSSYFGSPLIAHQCCDQLTAVKTRYPLTSITWPYRGLRCRPIQFEYFLKLSADKLLVFKWTQAHFFLFVWNVLCLCHYGLPWVPEVFSRVRRGAAFRPPNAEDTRGSLFKTWPKPETAHEKPLEPRVTMAQHY